MFSVSYTILVWQKCLQHFPIYCAFAGETVHTVDWLWTPYLMLSAIIVGLKTEVQIHYRACKIRITSKITRKQICLFHYSVIPYSTFYNIPISPDPDNISAILQMGASTTITDLHHFMGMANQLRKFSPKLATISQPFQALLSKQVTWTWSRSQEEAFHAVKDELTKPPVLALYKSKH